MNIFDLEVGQTVYFRTKMYVNSGTVKRVNKKTVTIDLKQDGHVGDKLRPDGTIKGLNEYHTHHLIKEDEYQRRLYMIKIRVEFKECFKYYDAKLSTDQKKRILDITKENK